MGLRIRKSIKIAPGVRLNLGSKSGSVSIGGKGVHYTTKLYGKKKKKTQSDGATFRFLGKVLYWMFIGWWWWPTRFICYDLPKFIIKKTKQLIAKAKAAKETEKPEA